MVLLVDFHLAWKASMQPSNFHLLRMVWFMVLIVSFLTAFTSCLIAIMFIKRSALASAITDNPNHRSLHTTVIPRIGGIGVAVGLVLSNSFQSYSLLLLYTCLAYACLFCVSLFDDFKPQSVLLRLAIQVLVVILWAYGVLLPSQPILVATAVALTIVWGMNVFNFMDGSDGLAANVTIFGFGAYAWAAVASNNHSLALLCLTACGTALAFMIFNWPQAQIFLGDSGSIPLGFLVGAVGLAGVVENSWPILFPFMLFSMHWIDATFTLCSRAARRQKIWESHNEHWYQKAIRSGASHRFVLLIHLVSNALIAALSITWLTYIRFLSELVQAFTILLVVGIPVTFGVWAEIKFKLASQKTPKI
jgi:UDP-GlcNAc:undecaprenyl-phosphate/decaprenyl-phosphate GlcNAc-1-phosphate transferase